MKLRCSRCGSDGADDSIVREERCGLGLVGTDVGGRRAVTALVGCDAVDRYPPAPMAGLPGKRASVSVGPPLLASGPSCNSSSLAAVRTMLLPTPLVSPPAA